MLAWNQQAVAGKERTMIEERERLLIFKNYGCRNSLAGDLTEDTSGHDVLGKLSVARLVEWNAERKFDFTESKWAELLMLDEIVFSWHRSCGARAAR